MDIPRTPRRSRIPKPWLLALGGLGVVLATLGLAQLQPAAPQVQRSTLWLGTVRRGPMLRQVHGSGTLQPIDQRFVSALTAGRVERVLARPGTRVTASTVLVELSNPDVQLEALDAERQEKLAEADLAGLRSTLETAHLGETTALAAARTEKREAQRALAVAETLAVRGLGSTMDVDRARDRVEESNERFTAETRRTEVAEESFRAQVELRQADLKRLHAIAEFQRARVSSMRVLALSDGELQELSLQPGQWVQPGQQLARVASSDHLKAVLQIPQGSARDLRLGLPATVDTHDGTVHGRVSRVDPAVENGTVTVEIVLEGALPRGARPDLSVDGTIDIDRLGNVLSVGRPASGASETTVRLFRLTPDGNAAERVAVELGRASFDAVEVKSGLREGDRVILSEMSEWDHVQRVRLR